MAPTGHIGNGSGWLYNPQFNPHWQRQNLYGLASWTNGMAFREFEFSEVGRPVIKISEIKNGISGQTKFTEREYDQGYLVTSGDMLFCWSGQPETSIDVFWWRGADGWLNQHTFKVEPRAGVGRAFFFYVLKYLRPYFIAIARNKQTTGLGHVTKADLEGIEVGLPPLSEQRAIAEILSALDDKIELNRRMNATLEAIARAIFKSWFVDFDPVRAKMEGRWRRGESLPGLPADLYHLFPPSFEDSPLGKIPKGWRMRELLDAFEINPTRSLPAGSEAPYLDMANMPTRSTRALDWINRRFTSGMKFISGDTLVARITPCLENGKTAFVDFLGEGQVGWGSTEYIVLRSKPPLPLEYSYFLARSDDFRAHAIANMTGTSGRQRVPPDCLKRFGVVIPPKPVAAEFGKLAHTTMLSIKAHEEESRTLAAIRDALLPKLISGEMRLNKAERVVEVA